MMMVGSLVTLGALAWLFLKLAAEGELKQELIEAGYDPVKVKRAVRYGRAKALEELGAREQRPEATPIRPGET
jgi:hypothetical protein